MNEVIKSITIGWLENNRGNGAFTSHAEDDMDFEKLDNSSLIWYFENWVLDNIDLENYDTDVQIEIGIYLNGGAIS